MQSVTERLRPHNETKEHFMLKQISVVLLWNMGCRYIGHEVYGMRSESDEVKPKQIIDTVGLHYANGEYRPLKVLDYHTDEFSHYRRRYLSRGIEAKVSRADFRNGYSLACDYTYIICPKGMIEKDEVPSYVGIIFVDMDNIEFPITQANVMSFTEIYKKPRKEHDLRFYDLNEEENVLYFNQARHDKFIHDTMDLISRENTQQLMFKNLFLHTDWLREGDTDAKVQPSY